jgi:uncharacterized MAPEG superfamily protein
MCESVENVARRRMIPFRSAAVQLWNWHMRQSWPEHPRRVLRAEAAMPISIPILTLVGFAAWTLLVLTAGIGLRRWALILTGRAAINAFPADEPHGSPAYRRAMRAHANCVENLPVYAAVVLSATQLGIGSPLFDRLALGFFAARLLQSLVHLLFEQTRAVAGFRFAFFLLQIGCVFAMIGLILAGRF